MAQAGTPSQAIKMQQQQLQQLQQQQRAEMVQKNFCDLESVFEIRMCDRNSVTAEMASAVLKCPAVGCSAQPNG